MRQALAITVILSLLLVACEPVKTRPTPTCGDGTCQSGEMCANDCELWPEEQTAEDVLSYFKNLTRNRTVEDYNTPVKTERTEPFNDSKILVESIQTYLPVKGFSVSSRYNLLSINENVSKVARRLTGVQMREVLKSGRLSSNTEAFGLRAASFEQLLTLKSGRVRFGLDGESDLVSTFLEFEEGEVIFEYFLGIRGGIFKFFEGKVISFLGHDYVMTEVTNGTLTFEGLSTPDKIVFRHQGAIIVNDDTVSREIVDVNYTMDRLIVQVKAPDDIRILPGTSLSEYLNDRHILLTNRLDLSYEGLTDAPSTDVVLDKTGERYRLQFVNNINLSYNVVLAHLEPFKIGDEDNNFIYTEPTSATDYKIKKDDSFPILNRKEFDGLSNILRLVDVDYEDGLITFEDPALEKFLIYFAGTPGVNATADLIVYDVVHKIRVGPDDAISVDMNGDGAFNGANVPIITWGNGVLRISNATTRNITLTFTTPAKMREDINKDLTVRITLDENQVSVNPLDLELHDDEDNLVGMTDYGTLFAIRRNTDESEQSGDDLLIKQPLWQRFAEVVVKAYE